MMKRSGAIISHATHKGQERKPPCATLNNGIRVVMLNNPQTPVAAMVMGYLVGSNEAPPGFPGMARA